MTNRRVRAVAGAMLALSLSGCGPKGIFGVGVQATSDNIVFGSQATPAPALPTPSTPAVPPAPVAQIPLPGFFAPALPVVAGAVPTPSASVACPSPPPGSRPVSAPSSYPDLRVPAAGTYSFGVIGDYVVAGKAGHWPDGLQRTVSQPFPATTSPLGAQGVADAPAVEYRVVQTSVTAQGYQALTTTVFGLVPVDPPGTAGPPTMAYGHVDLEEISTEYLSGPPAGTTTDFAPNPPIEVMSFPAHEGAAWTSTGLGGSSAGVNFPPSTTPSTATYLMTLNAAIGTKSAGHQDEGAVDVPICGRILQAWKVDIQPGSFVGGPTGTPCYTLAGYYDVATEMGSMIIRDNLQVVGGTSTAAGCDTTSPAYQSRRIATLQQEQPS